MGPANANANDQVTNYSEKRGYFSNLPKKVMQRFFWGAEDFILVQLILIMQKIIKKPLSGYFLAYPPKMHYSAQQCSAMYCSVNASIIHSRWVKYDPNHGLKYPKCVLTQKGWYLLISDAFGAIWVHYNSD